MNSNEYVEKSRFAIKINLFNPKMNFLRDRHWNVSTAVWDLNSTKFDCCDMINLFWINTTATGYS